MGFVGWLDRACEEEQQEEAPPMAPRRSDPPVEPPELKVTIGDALLFVMAVKVELLGERDKYDEFLEVLGEFNRGSIGTDDVVSRVMILLDGHPDLIHGFNEFLPSGYKIKVHGVKMQLTELEGYSH